MKSWILLLAIMMCAATQRCVAADIDPRPQSASVSYEAENAKTTGTLLGPDFDGYTPAREASGRQCVRLGSTGESISFIAKADANGLIIRYSIPDSADGKGADVTLSLFINNQPQAKLQLTSKYSHLYGDYPFSNDPSSGKPRGFWDELRVISTPIHQGDEIRLEKAADDVASEYLVDFIELESVPAALEALGNALSVTDFGATANDQSDDRPAFLAAIKAAKAQQKTVWIPPGRFIIKGAIDVSDVALQGAGMWYSTLVGVDDYVPANRISTNGTGSNITLSDFAIIGKLTYRKDDEPNDGIGGSFGTGSVVRNLWIEHTKAGAWLTNSDGLQIEGCRFRNTIADGINLCVGMRNTVVRNCTARGTGDDCFAMWPATYTPATFTPGLNRFVDCTAQLPFLAQGFAIYGGEGNTIENCRSIDIARGAGVLVSTTFPTKVGFSGTTAVKQLKVVRAGDLEGAVAVVANRIDLHGLQFEDIDIADSTTDGLRFTSHSGHSIGNASFDRIRIANTGLAGKGSGVATAAKAVGSVSLNDVTIINAKTSEWQIDTAQFKVVRDSENADLAEKPDANAQHPATPARQ